MPWQLVWALRLRDSQTSLVLMFPELCPSHPGTPIPGQSSEGIVPPAIFLGKDYAHSQDKPGRASGPMPPGGIA
jgi:hypothetical protein